MSSRGQSDLNFRLSAIGLVVVCTILASSNLKAADWQAVPEVLRTPFAAAVSPTNVHAEYPRPQLVRARWMTLNGLWDYAVTEAGNPPPSEYDGQILVPFPIESALSGVGKRFGETNRLWYHRAFTVPADWSKEHLQLHFGAVDWNARVYINGREAARHRGGYDPFSLDITPYLCPTNEQEILVAVEDPTEGQQPRGKQSRNPEGIFYTPSSGIWQTVWIEPVPVTRISGLRITPDLANRNLRLNVEADRMGSMLTVEAVALEEGVPAGRVQGPVNADLGMEIENPRAWSPDDPFLYDLRVRIFLQGREVDQVDSYFAMRDIAVRKDNSGTPRLHLNGEPVFQVGVLDQGFWPDGLYTAPSDDAWRHELGLLKRMGFNTVRKHVKVEPQRWYYWCDRLGLLVWQDMPSGNNLSAAARRQFEIEFERMVENLRNHPCIIMWVLFNEGWGQYDTERLVGWAQKMDPSRLIDAASGWVDKRVGNVADIHSYPGPELPVRETARVAVLGEFGGLGFAVPNHLWSAKTWGYEVANDRQQLLTRYTDLLKRVWMLKDTSPLSAVIYTQLSDVETECNGLLTYDRAVVKIDPTVARAANLGEERAPPARFLSPPATYGTVLWKYVTKRPGPRWNLRRYDMSRWEMGRAGFGGNTLASGGEARTRWDTPEIWLRRFFALRGPDLGTPFLSVSHDGDVEVYINGVQAASLQGASQGYAQVPIAEPAVAALNAGRNVLAAHAKGGGTNQFLDVGLVVPGNEAQAYP